MATTPNPAAPLTPQTTLAELAVAHPAASRVFHQNGLDYCCTGRRPLQEACAERGLDAAAILQAIEAETPAAVDHRRWDRAPLPELIDHLVGFYHRRLREELPQLEAMARKVESVHAEKASCPRGIADHVSAIHAAVLDHLAKEEQVLFPMLAAGRGRIAGGPIRVMEGEHDDHAENLRRTRELTTNLVPPPEACTTWRALYGRLDAFEAELMEHIHLENNVLFKRALAELEN